MVLSIQRQKFFSFFMALFLTITAFSVFAPASTVYATDGDKSKSTNIGDVSIEIGDDGSLKIDGAGMSSGTKSGSAWTAFISKYKTFIVGISGIGAVSMILFFVMNFIKLGATSGNPGERSKAISGLVWTGLAAAGLGAVTIIVGFFYSALK